MGFYVVKAFLKTDWRFRRAYYFHIQVDKCLQMSKHLFWRRSDGRRDAQRWFASVASCGASQDLLGWIRLLYSLWLGYVRLG